MAADVTRKILRYRLPERLVHWLGASAVLLLLITGLALLWPPLAGLAAGGWSARLHKIGAGLFMLAPILYAVLNRAGLRRLLTEPFTYDRDDWAWLKCMPRYFLGHACDMPPQGRINAGQKLHHAGTFLAFVTITLSGLLLWVGEGALGANGLALAAMTHDLSMLLLTVLLIGHVYFTFVYGALAGMTTGYVTEDYARMEHAKWLESLSKPAGKE
jgi:formate dehydrogenase subunit gamma